MSPHQGVLRPLLEIHHDFGGTILSYPCFTVLYIDEESESRMEISVICKYANECGCLFI